MNKQKTIAIPVCMTDGMVHRFLALESLPSDELIQLKNNEQAKSKKRKRSKQDYYNEFGAQ